MLILSILLCWLVAITHSFFRAPEGIVWVPFSIIFPVILAAPRVLYRLSPTLRRRVATHWVTQMERVGLAAVIINVPGVLFFHVQYPQFQYDRFLHVGGGFLILWWLALVLAPFRIAASRRRILTVLSISIFISLFAWEGWQWTQDQIFGSHTFYDYSQPITVDFWEDIGFGAVGMVIGLWSLNRRFPQYRSLRRL